MTSRVQVDLSQFFPSTDLRRKAYVRIGDFQKISHLQKHIISLFKLPASSIYLKSSDGVLFPKQEAISIIQPGDVLIACPRQKPVPTVNAKPVIVETPKPKIVTPARKVSSPDSDDDTVVLSVFEKQLAREDEKQETDLSPQAKRRKRVRKRKSKSAGPIAQVSKLVSAVSIDEGPPPRKFRSDTQEFFINSYPNRKHIKFDENFDENTGPTNDKVVVTKARLLKPLTTNLQALEPVVNVEEAASNKSEDEDNTTAPTTLCIEINETTDSDKSPVTVITKPKQSEASKNFSDIYTKIDELNFPSVTELPSVGDTVAFKMLRMNASYEPVISGYIVGVVEEVEAATSDILFLIKQGHAELQEQEGKFSLVNDENGKQFDLDKTVWVNYKDMLEPKRIK